MTPGEREAIELSLWHDLDDTDLAAVLDVSLPRAYALAANGRRQLEKALGALRIARSGRDTCPELGAVLAGWDGRLTDQVLGLVSQHTDQCEACTLRNRGRLRPEALGRLLPLPVPPPGLREQVLELGRHPELIADRPPPTPPAPSSPGRRLPQAAALSAGWDGIRRNPKVAAAAIVVLVAAAVSVPLMAIGGTHAVRDLVAQSGGGMVGDPGPASTATGGAPARSGTAASASPQPSGQGGLAPANFLEPSAASSKKVTPSKSPPPPRPSDSTQVPAASSSSYSSSAAPSPVPTHAKSSAPSSPAPSPSPTKTPTPTRSPSPSPAPSPSPSRSPSPSPSPSRSPSPTPA